MTADKIAFGNNADKIDFRRNPDLLTLTAAGFSL
jgi:hypothetical protein